MHYHLPQNPFAVGWNRHQEVSTERDRASTSQRSGAGAPRRGVGAICTGRRAPAEQVARRPPGRVAAPNDSVPVRLDSAPRRLSPGERAARGGRDERRRRRLSQAGLAVPACDARRPALAPVVLAEEVMRAVSRANLARAVAITAAVLELVIRLTTHHDLNIERKVRAERPRSGDDSPTLRDDARAAAAPRGPGSAGVSQSCERVTPARARPRAAGRAARRSRGGGSRTGRRVGARLLLRIDWGDRTTPVGTRRWGGLASSGSASRTSGAGIRSAS